jgi:hypothetical protein
METEPDGACEAEMHQRTEMSRRHADRGSAIARWGGVRFADLCVDCNAFVAIYGNCFAARDFALSEVTSGPCAVGTKLPEKLENDATR